MWFDFNPFNEKAAGEGILGDKFFIQGIGAIHSFLGLNLIASQAPGAAWPLWSLALKANVKTIRFLNQTAKKKKTYKIFP